MAREMNVDKRYTALHQIILKAQRYGAKANRIAEDLNRRFKGDKSGRGKSALAIARHANRVATALKSIG